MSGNTEIPAWLETMFAGLDDRPGARALVAATVAVDLCHRLYRGGVRDFHASCLGDRLNIGGTHEP